MSLIDKLNEIERKIGNTPLVDVDGVLCKIEGKNPAGSVKDRTAFMMIKRAVERGELQEGGVVVEATSGNMGIGLSYIARELGLGAVIVMPSSMSEQRRQMIASYGAELLLTPAENGMQGAVNKAKEYINTKGGWLANQFCNFDGIDAHFFGTAPEIFAQCQDVKCIVAGIGSGGTVMGLKKYIRTNNIDCQVVGVEPANSPLISKGIAGAHKIQGIGANFVPAIFDVNQLDGIEVANENEAISTMHELNRRGIDCGISSGAAYNVACKLKDKFDGKVVAIFPDSANRY